MIEVFENIINVYSNESITTVTIVSVLLMVLFLAVYEFFVYRFVSHRSFYNKSLNIRGRNLDIYNCYYCLSYIRSSKIR